MTFEHRRARRRPARGSLAARIACIGMLVAAGSLHGASGADRETPPAAGERTGAAIGALEARIRANPRDVVARNNLAVLYAAEGDLERARAHLIEAMNSDPRYALVYRNLTDIYDRFAALAYEKALYGDEAPSRAPLDLVSISPDTGGPVTAATAPVSGPPPATAPASPSPAAPSASAPPPAPPSASAPSSPAAPSAAPPSPTVITASTAPGPVAPAAPAPPVMSSGPPAVAAVDGEAADAGPPTTTRVPAPAAAPDADAARRAVTEVVRRWAAAWSAQDVDAYLGHYGSRFAPPDGMNRAEWEAQRRTRLERPRFIDVTIEAPQVTLSGPDRAEVRFHQTYRNDAFTSEVVKVLTLTRADGGWKIVEEVVRR